MESTTIKVSVATRDRIRSYGGATHEATIVRALDALDEFDADRFWTQAEEAKRAFDAMPVDEQQKVRDEYRRIETEFDALR